MPALQGFIVEWPFATPTMDFSKSPSLKPTARNIARLGERATPAVISWERLLRFVTSMSFLYSRAFFVQGKSIKLICRELRVSRKVVRKVIRSEATEFRYEREAQPLPKIGPWSDQLNELLLANEGKAARERLTLIRLFEELRGLGYAGGYDAVRRYARRWSRER